MPLVRDIAEEISNKRTLYISNQIINGIILWLTRIGTQFGQTYLTAKISLRMSMDIQETIYTKLHSLPQDFFNHWKIGELIVRMTSDANKVKEAIIVSLAQLIPQALSLLGVLVYLFMMCWELTCFTLLAIPAFMFTMSYFSERLKRLAHAVQKKTSNITHILQESIINMKLVQAYTMEDSSIKRFARENHKNFTYSMNSTRLWESKKAVELLLQGVIIFTILWFGGQLVAADTLSGQELLSFFVGCGLLIDPILAFSNGITRLQESIVSINRVYELIDIPPSIQSPAKGCKGPIKGTVSFKNVSFSYGKNKPNVLNNLTFTAHAGQTIALVGLSGAGKTTLVNLIPRFFEATAGHVTIDDTPITQYDLHALRRQIGMVLQDDILFSGSILENIKYGSPHATEEQVIQAAKQAHCWEFISRMPDKLFTTVGDQGRRLSGGQKQRISIARAILRNPTLLILDEATSALDTESEQYVQEALLSLMKHRTTFVIAHRLSTIKHASTIIVLKDGSILEHGTHDTLLNQNNHYANLYARQFR